MSAQPTEVALNADASRALAHGLPRKAPAPPSQQPEWEPVNFNRWQETARLRVPGGWLYRSTHFGYPPPDREEGNVEAVAVAFVPDVAAEART